MVAAQNAVAGNDDAQGIGSYGIGHGSDGLRLTCLLGQLRIAERVAVGNGWKHFPDFLLHGSANKEQGQGEYSPLMVEVFVKLRLSKGNDVGFLVKEGGFQVSLYALFYRGARQGFSPVAQAELVLITSQNQWATGRGIGLEVNGVAHGGAKLRLPQVKIGRFFLSHGSSWSVAAEHLGIVG